MPNANEPKVCARCFDDPGIQDFIRGASDTPTCSFCGMSSDDDIAAPIGDVVDHMTECLAEYYDDAANHLPYESREGGYQGVTWTTYELLREELELDLPNDHTDALFEALLDGLGDQTWCDAHPFSLSRDDRLRFSWEEFCELIKHRRRFFFRDETTTPGDEELHTPADLLSLIAEFAREMDLFRPILVGQKLFRARYQRPGESHETALDLGPPPVEFATQSNRMSPPGIVMFYLSEDGETALLETANAPAEFEIAKFETTREIRVMDLVDLPTIPSIFHAIQDSLPYNPRELLIFLHNIASEISKPIVRDDRVHVEYVPTQVITEYIRALELPDGNQLDGIRYTSSRRPGHASLVLFADQGNLDFPASQDPEGYFPSGDRWIKLKNRTNITVTSEMMEAWPTDPEPAPI